MLLIPSGGKVHENDNHCPSTEWDRGEDVHRWAQSPPTNLLLILRISIFLPYYVVCLSLRDVCAGMRVATSPPCSNSWEVASPNPVPFPFLSSNDWYTSMQSHSLARKSLFWDRPLAYVKKHFLKRVGCFCVLFFLEARREDVMTLTRPCRSVRGFLATFLCHARKQCTSL